MIHDPIPEHHGGAYVDAFTAQLVRAAGVLDGNAGIDDAARRSLVTQLLRRWLGCAITAFVADKGAPMSDGAWRTFLVKYPVCTRLFAESEQLWRRDCERLLAATAREVPGVALTGIDHHAGFLGSRRSAHVLAFANGRRLVYRPYALPAAAWFMDLCAALGDDLHRRAIRVDGDHTWDEFVDAAPCPPEAAGPFFRRAGMLVRLFEAVRAKDMHVRNVRLVGAHPVVLDLEGVLAHRDAPSPVAAGFLPVVFRGGNGERSELGGLHPGGTVTLPVRQPRLRDGVFEDIYPSRTLAATIPAPLHAHVDDVVAGYHAMNAAFARVDLGSFERIAFKTAVFVRPGVEYRALLYASMHPALLVDERLRDRYIHEHAQPIERAAMRSLISLRYVATAPAPSFVPHDAERLGVAEAAIRASLVVA